MARPASLTLDQSNHRGTWGRHVEFVLATVGAAVGTGNVWRFPYVCYRNGGGAFLIPYIIMLFLCAIPMVFLEFIVGQYTQKGPIQAFAKICPIMKGLGLASVTISFLISTFLNTIMSWILFYMFHSFTNPLPWTSCNNTWNLLEDCSSNVHTNVSHPRSPSQQFFDHRVLDISEGINVLGTMRWELAGLLVMSWAIEYLCIFKGVRITGKVVYITVLFPYAVLMALLINNVHLPGATEGMLFFLTPQWHKLQEIQVWIDAASQILFSTGAGFATMLSLASYNKFNSLLRDAVIVCVANSVTSVFAGFVIFSALGYMAHIQGLSVDDLAVEGPGLAFVVYPEILATMPGAQFWSVLFFLMLFCLGVDSVFASLEVMVTCAMDSLGQKLPSSLKRKERLLLLICLPGFLLSLTCVTQGGVYVFQLMEHYTVSVSIMVMAFTEVVAVVWIFGIHRFSAIVEKIQGKPPGLFFSACWLVITPLTIIIILITSLVQHTPAQYGKSYQYPAWAQRLGWMFTLSSVIWIPLGALHELYYREGTLLQRLKAATTVTKLTVDSDPLRHQDERVLITTTAIAHPREAS